MHPLLVTPAQLMEPGIGILRSVLGPHYGALPYTARTQAGKWSVIRDYPAHQVTHFGNLDTCDIRGVAGNLEGGFPSKVRGRFCLINYS